MARSNFERLRVYQAAETLADGVWNAVHGWDDFARRTVGVQLVRAAGSVGANIAEGAGRGSYRDNRRFVSIARGSLFETKYFLRRAHRRGLIGPDQGASLAPLMNALLPSINAYRRSIGQQEAVSRSRPDEPRATAGATMTTDNGQLTTDG